MERDFYRIECEETGLGPYQSGEYDCVLSPSAKRHPTPWNENLWDQRSAWDENSDYRSFVCGFKSIEQLNAWFDIASLKNMRRSADRNRRHYNVIHFRVHEAHIRIAPCQAVARRSFLKEVTRLSLHEFILEIENKMLTNDLGRTMVRA